MSAWAVVVLASLGICLVVSLCALVQSERGNLHKRRSKPVSE